MASSVTFNATGIHAGTDAPFHVAIIGGGITGLSAAFYIEKLARVSGTPVQYTVIEREPRFGGKVVTEKMGTNQEFTVEGGAESLETQKPWSLDLIRELGITDQVINPSDPRVWVLQNGQPCQMPDGMMMVIPTKFWPFIRSPLFSPLGKLRIGLDLVTPPKREPHDESLADFIRRRFGREALEKIGEPLMSVILSADAERQSMLAHFPRFRALEQEHGSLIKAALAQRRQMADQHRATTSGAPPQRPFAPFVSLRGGMGTLIDALVTQLTGRLLTTRQVVTIQRTPTSATPYQLRLDNAAVLAANAVIMATPAFVTADLVASFRPNLASQLARIRYVSSGAMSLAYRRRDIGDPLQGFGLIMPRSEQRLINSCTISSRQFSYRAPDDHVLIRVFVGGSRNPDLLALEDADLLALARSELQETLGITAAPVITRLFRWVNSFPQYELEHAERIKRIKSLCPASLYLGGSSYEGVSVTDCIRQGKELATQLMQHVQHHAYA
jgi:oxygen-dependent protoporphyrinogen oxidase